MSEKDKAKSTLDILLHDRDPAIKARLLEIVIKNQWDVNDPSFAIFVAMGQLEIFLEKYPDLFNNKFEDFLRKISQIVYEQQEQQAINQAALTKTAKNLTSSLDHAASTISQTSQEIKNVRVSITNDKREYSNNTLAAREREVLTLQALVQNVTKIQEKHQSLLDAHNIFDSLKSTVQTEIARVSRSTTRRVNLGQGMFSLWAGAFIVGLVFLVGILFGSQIYHFAMQNKYTDIYWNRLIWMVIFALAAPPMVGLGIYALEADYSTEVKFSGWIVILIPIGLFVMGTAKIFGWFGMA
jgi:hypothetical protein